MFQSIASQRIKPFLQKSEHAFALPSCIIVRKNKDLRTLSASFCIHIAMHFGNPVPSNHRPGIMKVKRPYSAFTLT
jgi:hypothetical protein